MDEFAKQLVLQLPNLGFAVFAVWWSFRRIDRMIDHNEHLVSVLLELARANREMATVASNGDNHGS